ncbi:hypothetical protein GGR54DRAFT_549123 [Hypoxylon sp. NC1633]|nr:hypothetical protein GGR54DRAFT_549123 [Hypoxylon sp. NC1633]
MSAMEKEELDTPLSTQATLVSRSSTQSLITTRSSTRDDRSLSTSMVGRVRLQLLSQRKGLYPVRTKKKRRPKSTRGPSKERDACPQCLSTGSPESETSYFENIVKQLADINARQEALLSRLPGINYTAGSTEHCRFQPRLDVLSSSSLKRYLEMTLHPDPIRLCDIFLARFNLPQILSGSYDPIELNIHGWEPEGYDDIIMVVGLAMYENPTNDNSKGIEVPWKHVDHTREPHLTLKLNQIAPCIKEQWLYQGRSIRDWDEVDAPSGTDECADSLIFLKCPGTTTTTLYQSSYDPSGAHFSREPWLSGRRSLLRQLQPGDDSLRVDRSCPWDGKVFGRLW